MKRIALLLIPLLIQTSTASAWVGGPWSFNSYGTNASTGTYQGVMSGNGVQGVFLIGTSPSSDTSSSSALATTSTDALSTANAGTSGSEGRAAIFVDGYVVICGVTTAIDVAGRSISGVVEGSKVRSVQALSQMTANSNVSASLSGSSSSSTTTTVSHLTFTDVLNISGSFDAKISEVYPLYRFSGSGDLTVSHPDDNGPVQYVGIDFHQNVFTYGGENDVTTSALQPVIVQENKHFNITGSRTSTTTPTFNNTIQIQNSNISYTN